jgi:multidrug resistance protein
MTPAALVFFTVFLDLIGFGIVLPLLPSYAAAFHVSETAIGLLVASFSAMQFLLAPSWGRLSDRVGRRPVLLVGLAGSTLSYLLFASADSFAVLLISRIVAGGMGATVNVAQAYLADVTPPAQRSRAMGLVGAAFGLGFVVGPALGGISSRWGGRGPGLLAAAISGTGFLLTWWWLPESRTHQPIERRAPPEHWTRYLMPFTVVALTTVGFTVMYVIFPLEAERALGYDRHQVAYLFVVMGLVSAVVQGGLVGRLAARFGEQSLMVTGGVLMAASLGGLPVALAPGQGQALLLLALSGLGLGSALVGPSAAAWVSRSAGQEEQGRALGLLQSVGAVARIVGPLLAGGLTHGAGARMAFLTAGGAAGAAGLLAALPISSTATAER